MKVLLLFIMITQTALAGPPTCKDVITACDLTIHEQDLSIQNLKEDKKRLENAVVEAQDEGSIMKWFYLGIGVLSGFGVGYLTTRNH
jgi:hypothetical protein